MNKYRVIAMYDYPEINRSIHIDAENPQQAILRAVIERRLAIAYARDQQGNLQPLFWRPEMGGETRWPQIEKNHRLTWKSPHHQGQLRFEIEKTA